jgi:hypothetical protein
MTKKRVEGKIVTTYLVQLVHRVGVTMGKLVDWHDTYPHTLVPTARHCRFLRVLNYGPCLQKCVHLILQKRVGSIGLFWNCRQRARSRR